MDTNNLKRLILTALGVSLISTRISFAQENIISFYPKAYAKTQNPSDGKKLSVIAEQKIEDKYVTFIGVENGKVLLAAVTKEKIRNPSKAISLKPFATEMAGKVVFELLLQFALDTLYTTWGIDTLIFRDSLNWGYIFDRNSDGKIDYISFLVGPMPIKQKDFPEDFPKGNLWEHYFKDQLDSKHKNVLINSCRLVFTHMADDNFDGKLDGVVIEAMDSDRYWVDRWMVLRTKHFEGAVDTCWQFKESIQVKERGCLRLRNGFWTHRAGGKKGEFGNAELVKISEALSFLNQASNLCGLTKDSFYKE